MLDKIFEFEDERQRDLTYSLFWNVISFPFKVIAGIVIINFLYTGIKSLINDEGG